jgi:hypothetical protein
MYVRGYLQGSENGRVVTIALVGHINKGRVLKDLILVLFKRSMHILT